MNDESFGVWVTDFIYLLYYMMFGGDPEQHPDPHPCYHCTKAWALLIFILQAMGASCYSFISCT